jgi:hypothetical protein
MRKDMNQPSPEQLGDLTFWVGGWSKNVGWRENQMGTEYELQKPRNGWRWNTNDFRWSSLKVTHPMDGIVLVVR